MLTELTIEHTQLSEILTGTFENLNSLEYLYLTYNKLEHVDCDVFRGLVNLNYIDLSGNKLQYLHPDTFLGLPNLQRLDLAFNRGLRIPTDRNFIKSYSLSFLHIGGCNISSLSVETFANVSAIK